MRRVEMDGGTQYRADLAKDLRRFRSRGQSNIAALALDRARSTIKYKLARGMHRKADGLAIPLDGEAQSFKQATYENASFGYYRSNEFYAGLAPELKGLGGVGLAVGSDQGLDFYNMANLDEVYNIDVDPNTHIITRSYLELGARFHKLFDRYPTADEYISLFHVRNWSVTLHMLSAESSLHTFPPQELEWLRNHYGIDTLEKTHQYLLNKKEFYGDNSWIGTDSNLAHTIEGYEQGKIHVNKGSIKGRLLPIIAQRTIDKGQKVTLIYTSNAPIESNNPIQAFRTLPVDDSTRIIYSSKPWNYKQAPVPDNFAGVHDSWSFFVFSPTEFESWPVESASGIRRKVITPGCYRLTQTKKGRINRSTNLG